ncbi:hypothetical protein [Methanosarcina sp.]|uniref:hypothetical protein n=1 Tax=Methanosarcina sp. TaxID=2213 RepID=UPI003C7139D8
MVIIVSFVFPGAIFRFCRLPDNRKTYRNLQKRLENVAEKKLKDLAGKRLENLAGKIRIFGRKK